MGRHPLPRAAAPGVGGPGRSAWSPARGVPVPRPVPSMPSTPLPPLPALPPARSVPSARSLLAEAARDHHRAIERHADAAASTEAADTDLARTLAHVDGARAQLCRARRGLALTVEVDAVVRGEAAGAARAAEEAAWATARALAVRDAARRVSRARRRASAELHESRAREAVARRRSDDAAASVEGSSLDLDAARRARDEAHRRLMTVLPLLCRARAQLLDARADEVAAREEERDAADRLARATTAMVRADGSRPR